MKDLVILAADKDMEHAPSGLLARPRALGIRPIAFDVFVHPEHDPGCALRGGIEAGSDLSIVSAYFSIYAYEALRDTLEDAGRVRFLYGKLYYAGGPVGTSAVAGNSNFTSWGLGHASTCSCRMTRTTEHERLSGFTMPTRNPDPANYFARRAFSS